MCISQAWWCIRDQIQLHGMEMGSIANQVKW